MHKLDAGSINRQRKTQPLFKVSIKATITVGFATATSFLSSASFKRDREAASEY